MKAKTILFGSNGEDKLNHGDSVMALQGTKTGDEIYTNMDWSFDESWNFQDIKSMLGGVLGSIEEIFGEKMVTEMIAHWAAETGKLQQINKTQAVVVSKSHGLKFKKK